MAKILLLEDDPWMAEALTDSILEKLADIKPEVELLETEADFVLRWLPEFKKKAKPRPDAIIIDGMVSWTDPDGTRSENDPPPEVIAGGYAKAGMRCYGLIQRDPELAQCKVILYTNLSGDDLARLGGKPSGLVFVSKALGEAPLLKSLRNILENAASAGTAPSAGTLKHTP